MVRSIYWVGRLGTEETAQALLKNPDLLEALCQELSPSVIHFPGTKQDRPLGGSPGDVIWRTFHPVLVKGEDGIWKLDLKASLEADSVVCLFN